jgi:hypothetical protein
MNKFQKIETKHIIYIFKLNTKKYDQTLLLLSSKNTKNDSKLKKKIIFVIYILF